jgi:hypothetical protein
VYETLGVCSQCADISDYLTYACITNRVDWTSQLKGGFGVETQYLTAAMCGYFLNATGENPILMSGYLVKANSSNEDEALIMRALPLTNLTSREPLFGNGSIHFKDMRNTLADVLIVAAVNGTADTVYRKVPPIAQECVLSLCVKTIVSTYDSGKYEENIVETHLNTTAGEFPWVGFPYKDESGNGTDIFYMQDININGTTHDGRSISGYGTSNRTAYSIIQGFADIFPSFATTPNTSNISVLRYKIYKEGPAFNRQLVYNPWLYPNVTDHMDRLATAMTNVIRSAPSKIIMTGNAFGKETYIAVYWKWLAFPFILLFLSLVFLVATIIKTSKDREIGVWKTSAMPTLISSLPQEIQPDLTKTSTWRSTSGVEAKRVKIRLMPNQRWRVSGEMRAPASPTFLTRKKNCNPHLVGYEQS